MLLGSNERLAPIRKVLTGNDRVTASDVDGAAKELIRLRARGEKFKTADDDRAKATLVDSKTNTPDLRDKAKQDLATILTNAHAAFDRG